MKIKDLIILNNENNDYLANLEINKLDKIKTYVIGYFIAFMIVASPIIITAHFFIYNFYYKLVLFVLTILVFLFFSLGEIFSHKFLQHFAKNSEKRSLKITHLFDSTIYLLMSLICYIIIILIN